MKTLKYWGKKLSKTLGKTFHAHRSENQCWENGHPTKSNTHTNSISAKILGLLFTDTIIIINSQHLYGSTNDQEQYKTISRTQRIYWEKVEEMGRGKGVWTGTDM